LIILGAMPEAVNAVVGNEMFLQEHCGKDRTRIQQVIDSAWGNYALLKMQWVRLWKKHPLSRAFSAYESRLDSTLKKLAHCISEPERRVCLRTFLPPPPGLTDFCALNPRLAPWAVFLRRFAAKI
jgi:hypothetical protein